MKMQVMPPATGSQEIEMDEENTSCAISKVSNNGANDSYSNGSGMLVIKNRILEDGQDCLTTPSTTPSSSPDQTPISSPALSASPSPEIPSFSLLSTNDPPSESWVAPASKKSLRTHNPIRAIVDPIMANSIKSGKDRGDGKDQISLALGDPTTFGFEPCPVIVSAITKAMQTPSLAAGYVNACGTLEARVAIAKHHSNESIDNPIAKVTPDDVIVANGASGALELALSALLDDDTILLVPRPGFPLYQVIAESHGARVVHYDLLPSEGWECDLNQIESIMEEDFRLNSKRKVRGILVNNPSNPTGAVYSESHLMDIILLARRYQLPIVSDEIYGDMTFNGEIFHPMATVAARLGSNVPIITASGLGKQYLVPGWRLGWIVFHDSSGTLKEVKKGAQNLAQVVLGASHLVQVAIPAVLNPSNETDHTTIAIWKEKVYNTIENQANVLCSLLGNCHGLQVINPQGAMYAMVRIQVEKFDDDIVDDISFMRLLLNEENIVVLPGKAFGLNEPCTTTTTLPCYVFRVVFCAPANVLRAASERIYLFCNRHRNTTIN